MNNLIEKCCICGDNITGYGNSPEPVKQEGRCCENCNFAIVIPERIFQSKRK